MHADLEPDRYWINKSLLFSGLSALSLFIFAGIMESQLIFIRHITTALQNRDYWGSLYLRNPEKVPPIQKKRTLSVFWFSLICLFLYTVISLVSVILILASPYKDLSIAICTSLLFIVLCINTITMLFFTRKNAVRRNRDDLLFLRITPIFFALGLGGMTILAWLNVSQISISVMLWILLETFFVYSPFLCVLLMCIHTGKFKKMGRQYRIEEDQKLYNYRSYISVQRHPPPPY